MSKLHQITKQYQVAVVATGTRHVALGTTKTYHDSSGTENAAAIYSIIIDMTMCYLPMLYLCKDGSDVDIEHVW